MANATTDLKEKDYARYKLLRQTIPYFSSAAGDTMEDIVERSLLEAKYPDFPARYEKETKHTNKAKVPIVPGLGGKRKRSRKTKRRYRRHAAQSHRRF